jgi:N-methylhydantoinase A
MLASPPRHCFVRTHIFPVAELATSRAPALWDDLRREALDVLGREGVDAASVLLAYTADMRYAGQVHQVEVELDAAEVAARDAGRIAARFHRAHEALYGYADAHTEVECVNLRLSATTAPAPIAFRPRPFAGEDPSRARKGDRRALFDAARGFVETSVFDAARLASGNVIDGPAIIEESDTTIVVLPGYRAVCDQWGNYHLAPAPGADAAL